MFSRIPKTLKIVFGLVFFPILIAIVARTLRVRILSIFGTGFYSYILYHVFTKDILNYQDQSSFQWQKMVMMTYFWGFVTVVCVGMAFEAVFGKESTAGTTEFGSRGKHIRGRIYKTVKRFGPFKNGPLKIGQHSINPEILKTHTIVAGTTGAGKTTALYPIIKYIVDNHLKAIITDPKVEFTSRFFKKGDVVLSPFYAESQAWTPFCEVENFSDCVSIAKYLIPEEGGSGENESWNAYSRDFLTDIFFCLMKENVRKTSVLLGFLNNPQLAETLFQKHKVVSAGLYQKGSEKLLQSVRFVSSKTAKSLSILSDEGNFSVRKWAEDPNGGILWLPYTVKQRDSLTRLLPLWISLGISGSMLPQRVNSGHQTFFMLDEIDSIGTIDKLTMLVTEGRGYGLSGVFGFQNVGQIVKRYGKDANSVLGVVNNFLIFKQGAGTNAGGNQNDAAFWSDFIGDEEIERREVSTSKRGLDVQGKNEHDRIEKIRLVMPEELTSLERRHGYCIFADDIDEKTKAGVVRDIVVPITDTKPIFSLNERKVDPLMPDLESLTQQEPENKESEEQERLDHKEEPQTTTATTEESMDPPNEESLDPQKEESRQEEEEEKPVTSDAKSDAKSGDLL